MWNDVVELNDFYQSPLGERARQMIRLRLRALWPDLRDMSVLGLGYASPYLRQFAGEAQRIVAARRIASPSGRFPWRLTSSSIDRTASGA